MSLYDDALSNLSEWAARRDAVGKKFAIGSCRVDGVTLGMSLSPHGILSADYWDFEKSVMLELLNADDQVVLTSLHVRKLYPEADVSNREYYPFFTGGSELRPHVRLGAKVGSAWFSWGTDLRSNVDYYNEREVIRSYVREKVTNTGLLRDSGLSAIGINRVDTISNAEIQCGSGFIYLRGNLDYRCLSCAGTNYFARSSNADKEFQQLAILAILSFCSYTNARYRHHLRSGGSVDYFKGFKWIAKAGSSVNESHIENFMEMSNAMSDIPVSLVSTVAPVLVTEDF